MRNLREKRVVLISATAFDFIASFVSYTTDDEQDSIDLADDVDTYGGGEEEEDVADDKDRAGVYQSQGLLGTAASGWKNQIWQRVETIIRWWAASIRRFS
ncbi:hypothetical protein NC651_034735 [Populus alba x Populus x berolinensis]|nr:hypothetical protein NC651_034735 [Populus alba x Populus x berolinensis]